VKFVNRTEEQKRLRGILDAPAPALAVVYGRRRLGKSTLIKKTLAPADIYFLADQTEAPRQIRLLAAEIARKIDGFDKALYPDWHALLETLNSRTPRKFTLCLDEFPYIVKNSPELPSILQKLLDTQTLRYNLILCGSSQTMMQGLVLDSKAPLYGRAAQILKIAPLSPPHIAEYLSCDPVQAIEEHAIWGGVPRYWELRQKNKTLLEAIEYHIINPQGTLYEEPYRLLYDDMRDIIQAATLLSVIGAGANRLTEIAARVEKPATHLSRPLDRLVDLGFIAKEIPHGENPRKTKKSLYKIADPFMNFFHRFVIPNRTLIELGRAKTVLSQIKPSLATHTSRHWEQLCRDAVSGSTINGITYGPASRWWGAISRDETLEIDIVAQSLDKKTILIGECKWSAITNPETQTARLLEKAKKLPLTQGKTLIPALFVKTSNTATPATFTPKDILNLL